MALKKKIEGREEIRELVDAFYEKVGKDPILGPVFNEDARVDWDTHLPKMYDFWETILFGGKKYKGDPMTKHVELNTYSPLTKKHFERWLALFKETVTERFEGNMADHVIQRAQSIASLMEAKVQNGGSRFFSPDKGVG